MTRRLCSIALPILLSAGVQSPAPAQTPPSPTSMLTRILDHGRWSQRDFETVYRRLHDGAEVTARSPRGVTVLMFAAGAGDLDLMRSTLKAGVEVNAHTAEGLTALWFAIRTRQARALRLLLDHGADANATDDEGRTPLMTATHFKFRAGIELLAARGARVNARNRKGYTTLAYTDDHPGITRLLRTLGTRE